MTEEIDAGAELARGFDRYEKVKAAFWVKAVDNPHKYLYIASDGINDSNNDVAYGEMIRLTSEIRSAYLDPFRVKLVNASDPLARATVENHGRFPGHIPTRFSEKSFGAIGVEDTYIDSSPLPAACS